MPWLCDSLMWKRLNFMVDRYNDLQTSTSESSSILSPHFQLCEVRNYLLSLLLTNKLLAKLLVTILSRNRSGIKIIFSQRHESHNCSHTILVLLTYQQPRKFSRKICTQNTIRQRNSNWLGIWNKFNVKFQPYLVNWITTVGSQGAEQRQAQCLMAK